MSTCTFRDLRLDGGYNWVATASCGTRVAFTSSAGYKYHGDSSDIVYSAPTQGSQGSCWPQDDVAVHVWPRCPSALKDPVQRFLDGSTQTAFPEVGTDAANESVAPSHWGRRFWCPNPECTGPCDVVSLQQVGVNHQLDTDKLKFNVSDTQYASQCKRHAFFSMHNSQRRED